MENLRISLDPAAFDAAVHGDGRVPVLPQVPDLAFYVKPEATLGGKAGVVITFTVKLPDGSFARAQAVTTAALMEQVGAAIRGWRSGGHIQ